MGNKENICGSDLADNELNINVVVDIMARG